MQAVVLLEKELRFLCLTSNRKSNETLGGIMSIGNFNALPLCSRTMDSDLTLGNSLGLVITLDVGGMQATHTSLSLITVTSSGLPLSTAQEPFCFFFVPISSPCICSP